MLRNGLRKGNAGGLVIAGIAAFAYYKYSKMSAEEKSNLANMIMEKGKTVLGQLIPGMVAGKTVAESAPVNNSF